MFVAAGLSMLFLLEMVRSEHSIHSMYYPSFSASRQVAKIIEDNDVNGDIAGRFKIYAGASQFWGFDLTIFRIDSATYLYNSAADLSQIQNLTPHAIVEARGDNYHLAHYPSIKRGVIMKLMTAQSYTMINLLGWIIVFFAMLWMLVYRLIFRRAK